MHVSMLSSRWIVGAVLVAGVMGGCQPRTPTEKAKDKMEDAGHEVNQGMERAKDRVKDATN